MSTQVQRGSPRFPPRTRPSTTFTRQTPCDTPARCGPATRSHQLLGSRLRSGTFTCTHPMPWREQACLSPWQARSAGNTPTGAVHAFAPMACRSGPLPWAGDPGETGGGLEVMARRAPRQILAATPQRGGRPVTARPQYLPMLLLQAQMESARSAGSRAHWSIANGCRQGKCWSEVSNPARWIPMHGCPVRWCD